MAIKHKPIIMLTILIIGYLWSYFVDPAWLGQWLWLVIKAPFAFINSFNLILNTVAAILFALATLSVIALVIFKYSSGRNTQLL